MFLKEVIKGLALLGSTLIFCVVAHADRKADLKGIQDVTDYYNQEAFNTMKVNQAIQHKKDVEETARVNLQVKEYVEAWSKAKTPEEREQVKEDLKASKINHNPDIETISVHIE